MISNDVEHMQVNLTYKRYAALGLVPEEISKEETIAANEFVSRALDRKKSIVKRRLRQTKLSVVRLDQKGLDCALHAPMEFRDPD